MTFRRTRGIVTDSATSDPARDADYIVAAAVAGLAVERAKAGYPTQFDMSPRDAGENETQWNAEWQALQTAVARLDGLVASHFASGDRPPVKAGLTVDHERGAVVIGVYELAGHPRPTPAEIRHPEVTLSEKGRALYAKIVKRDQDALYQYVGLGAYTGFVDNPNTDGDTDPVGPMPTARFLTPRPETPLETGEVGASWLPRWLPSGDSQVWSSRLRRGTENGYVPWGLIGGEQAGDLPRPNEPHAQAVNRADQITLNMRDHDGMCFHSDPTVDDVAGYTHGMIQAMYKAYHLGPQCRPFEITVGKKTTKLASCFPCTLFMTANGYPPSSTHLGRGDSWVPLYEPYLVRNADEHSRELAVIRDLNNSFARYCAQALRTGANLLSEAVIPADYRESRAGLLSMLDNPVHQGKDVAVSLFLDALTVHGKVIDRFSRVLGAS